MSRFLLKIKSKIGIILSVKVLLLLFLLSQSHLHAEVTKYYRALRLYEQGVLLESEREVGVFLKSNPDDFDGNLLLARILLRLGEYHKLKIVAEKLNAMQPDNNEIKEMLAKAKRETEKEIPMTIRDLEAALLSEPQNIGIRIQLIDIYLQQRNYAQADKHFKEILRLRPNDGAYRLRYARFLAQRNRTTEAEREYLSYLRLQNNNAVRRELFQVLLRPAVALVNQSKFEEAAAEYQKIINRYPEERYLQLEYARLLAWSEKYEESLKAYDDYLSESNEPAVRLERTRVLSWMNDYAQAIVDINELIDDEPELLDAYVLLGDIYRWTDNKDDAQEYYDFVLKKNPNHSEALAGLYELEKLAELREQEAATLNIGKMREALARDKNDFKARLQLARLLGIAAEYKESAEHYEYYIKERPDEIAIRLEYSRVLSSLARYNDAIRESIIYLDEFPDDLNVRINLANLYLWSEDYVNAERVYKEILEEHPDNLACHWNLARMYRNRENWDEAIKHLRIISELSPNNLVAQAQIREIESHPRFNYRAGSESQQFFYKPTVVFTYGYMRDHEDYSEKYGQFTFYQPFYKDNTLDLSLSRYFFNQRRRGDVDLGIASQNTLVVRTDRFSAGLSSQIDLKTSGRIYLGLNKYNPRYQLPNKQSYFFGVQVSYILDELNTIALAYTKDDGIYELKTVKSLEQAIYLDKFFFRWDRKPTKVSEDAQFMERIALDGSFTYGMLSDNNRQMSYQIRMKYPLKRKPNIDILAGWSYLNYEEQKPNDLYWSPKNHQGPFLGGLLEGEYGKLKYELGAEIAFSGSSVGASRILHGKLTYSLFRQLNASLYLSHTESPRQDDSSYNHTTTIFELIYNF